MTLSTSNDETAFQSDLERITCNNLIGAYNACAVQNPCFIITHYKTLLLSPPPDQLFSYAFTYDFIDLHNYYNIKFALNWSFHVWQW